MPPIVALLLTGAFIVFLFRRDFREKPNVTGALWIPILWMLLLGSRSVAQWLSLRGYGLRSTEEGNPIDALVYFILIAAGFYVLNQRQVSLSEIVRNNGWLMAFLLYCFVAIVWSDFPFVSFKRWIKIIGHPIMILIVLTEPDPEEALTRLMKRCAYVLVPISILFIKYYPAWGRTFDPYTGLACNTGITKGKNALGCDLLILGFFFSCYAVKTWRSERSRARKRELLLCAGFLIMILYLFRKADSATAFLSLLVGLVVVALLGLRFVNKRLIGMYVILGVITLVVAELAFGLIGYVVDLTRHDTTLAGRAALWRELLAMDTNPIFGVGFESFWLGERLAQLKATHWWQPNEAHNGYLEIFLDLGLVGLLILVGVIIATFRKARLDLLRNFEWGRVRMGFLAVVILYNWTESAFRGLNLLWFAFYTIALDYSKPEYESVVQPSQATGVEDEAELAYGPSGER
jgi:exopolysaccharide production protein ExoQ